MSNVRDLLTEAAPDGADRVELAELAVDKLRAYLEDNYLDGVCTVNIANVDKLLAGFETQLMAVLLTHTLHAQEKVA